jgi:hypothetical protein
MRPRDITACTTIVSTGRCTTVLINFTFSNFKSYRDAQQFSMQRPTNAQKHEDGDWALKEYSTVAGVYGGNASGKSAFIDAFQAVTDFVCNGLNPNLDLNQELQPFRLDPDSRNCPTQFLVDFLGTDDTRYLYELSVRSSVVEFESLRYYSGSRTSRIFERELDGDAYTFRYGRTFTGAKKNFERMVRPEVPYLTVLYATNVPIVGPVYEFFRNRVGFYRANLYDSELEYLKKGLQKGTPTAKALASLMASSDLGISVVQPRDPLEELQESSQQPGDPREGGYEDLASGVLALLQPGLTKEERRRQAQGIAKMPPMPRYELSFTHRGKNGFEETFNETEESSGTRAILAFFSLALRLLSVRSVGFIDEIDSSLHPSYVQELVALFKDPRTNPHQSQLIFTTHDVSLITKTGADKRVLDQDQIWLVEKGADGASTLYPVTSLPSRWDENFGRNYLHGVYGAVPRPGFHEAFADAEEDLREAQAAATEANLGGEN